MNLKEHEQKVEGLRQALIDGEASGDAGPLDFEKIKLKWNEIPMGDLSSWDDADLALRLGAMNNLLAMPDFPAREILTARRKEILDEIERRV